VPVYEVSNLGRKIQKHDALKFEKLSRIDAAAAVIAEAEG
jgi:hypothetical protein